MCSELGLEFLDIWDTYVGKVCKWVTEFLKGRVQ